MKRETPSTSPAFSDASPFSQFKKSRRAFNQSLEVSFGVKICAFDRKPLGFCASIESSESLGACGS
eukprot:scaffold1311_cov256-Pinguiococcus_pyrenoidosus.AAC.12